MPPHPLVKHADAHIEATVPEPTAAEVRGTHRKQIIGAVLGLVGFALAFWLMPHDAAAVATEAAKVARVEPEKIAGYSEFGIRLTMALSVLMGIWWMFEVMPLAATALLPLVVFPVLQVAKFTDVAAPFANDIVFLFMGGFFIALGMQRWNLHRRLALTTILLVGSKPRQLVLGFMLTTGLMSMWVNNTAMAMLMMPIGLSVLELVKQMAPQHAGADTHTRSNFGTALMLGIAYSASIGGLGTIVGSVPNAFLVGFVKEAYGINVSFLDWFIVMGPMAVIFLLAGWWLLVYVLFPPEMDEIPGGRELIREDLRSLGRMTRPEISVAILFALAAILWIGMPIITQNFFPNISIKESTIAMFISVLLFLIPAGAGTGEQLLDWPTAKEGVPWGMLLLFGGGLSLSAMFSKTGLAVWISTQAQVLKGFPVIVMILMLLLLVQFLTEIMSNTATSATFLPIVGGVAMGLRFSHDSILVLAIPVALAASCAFMLPVSTPPNAIAYATGYLRMPDIIKAGILFNVLATVLMVLACYFIVPPVFGLSLP